MQSGTTNFYCQRCLLSRCHLAFDGDSPL